MIHREQWGQVEPDKAVHPRSRPGLTPDDEPRPDTRYAEARFRAADARLSAVKDPTAAILDLANGLEVLVQAILTDRTRPATAYDDGAQAERQRVLELIEVGKARLVDQKLCQERDSATHATPWWVPFEKARATLDSLARDLMGHRWYWNEGPGANREAFREDFRRLAGHAPEPGTVASGSRGIESPLFPPVSGDWNLEPPKPWWRRWFG